LINFLIICNKQITENTNNPRIIEKCEISSLGIQVGMLQLCVYSTIYSNTVLFLLFIVNDTGGKFAPGVVDTGGKFAAGTRDTPRISGWYH
jgi:hypothetical protein